MNWLRSIRMKFRVSLPRIILEAGRSRMRRIPDNYANVSVDGMTPEQFEYMKLEMQAGRNLTRADNLGKKESALLRIRWQRIILETKTRLARRYR